MHTPTFHSPEERKNHLDSLFSQMLKSFQDGSDFNCKDMNEEDMIIPCPPKSCIAGLEITDPATLRFLYNLYFMSVVLHRSARDIADVKQNVYNRTGGVMGTQFGL